MCRLFEGSLRIDRPDLGRHYILDLHLNLPDEQARRPHERGELAGEQLDSDLDRPDLTHDDRCGTLELEDDDEIARSALAHRHVDVGKLTRRDRERHLDTARGLASGQLNAVVADAQRSEEFDQEEPRRRQAILSISRSMTSLVVP